jgi:hypothetical protein
MDKKRRTEVDAAVKISRLYSSDFNTTSFNWWFFTLSTQAQQLKQEMNNKKL